MCLYTNSSKPLVAKEDLYCLKVVSEFEGKFYTPYVHCDITDQVKKMLKNENAVLEASGEKEFKRDLYWFKIGEGFIHSLNIRYLGVEETVDTYKCERDNPVYPSEEIHVLLCVIPEGCMYYRDTLISDSYASDRIIIKKDITDLFKDVLSPDFSIKSLRSVIKKMIKEL